MYGATGTDELMTEEAPLRPLTAYAESKVRAEEALSELADADFAPVFMRNATAYGASPRVRLDVVLNNLAAWAFTTGKVLIMSDGTPVAAPRARPRHCGGGGGRFVAPIELVANEAFNVGANSENYRVRDLADIVRETFPGCEIEYAEGAGPDPRSYRVDFRSWPRRCRMPRQRGRRPVSCSMRFARQAPRLRFRPVYTALALKTLSRADDDTALAHTHKLRRS